MSCRKIAKIAVSAATYWLDRPYDYIIPAELVSKVAPGMRVTVPFSRGNRRTEGIVLALAETSDFDNLKSVDFALDESPVLTEEQLKLALWMRDRFFCTVFEAVKTILPAGLWFDMSCLYKISKSFDRASAMEAAGRSKREKLALEIIFARGGASDVRDIETAFGDDDPNSALRSLVKKGVLETSSREKRRVNDKTVNTARLNVSCEEAMAYVASKRRTAPSQAAVLELLCAVGEAAVKEICYFTGASASTVKTLVEKELISLETIEVFRRPVYTKGETAPLPLLNEDQEAAFGGILQLTNNASAQAALLFGVTGSGKTSIYIRLIARMLDRGRSSILLVPEIALTPQMLETFSSHFGDNIAVLHSSLSIGERYDEWKRIKRNEARVVIGTRSAVFAPVSDLGIIIIDEEQEDTYKSENAPRYHARDVAKYLCAKSNALLLMGSATPDICSRYFAEMGRYSYFALPVRYNLMELPRVSIVDMKRELRRGNGGNISSTLRDEIAVNIERGEQSILFLNRRGSNRLITCSDCGYTYSCPRCSVSLTYHADNHRLMCHYCGYSRRVGDECPECGGTLSFVGAGTQKIEQELLDLFPGVGILRMDTDTVGPAGSHEALLRRFAEKKLPIMVGTQMVTKGLNFENVTLVGVISADQALYSGDYRSNERTFSLITQVVGRSGRGERPGRAVIQTFTPQNQVILQAAEQDYDSFYDSEIKLREVMGSPPFSELFALTASGLEESAVLRCCTDIRNMLTRELSGREDCRILGPAPLPVVKVNNRFRYRMTLACRGDQAIRNLISSILVYCNKAKEYKGISVFADIDPND